MDFNTPNEHGLLMSNLAQDKTIKIMEELLQVYHSQIIDLTMMSKIELGDDVIAEIHRLKSSLFEIQLREQFPANVDGSPEFLQATESTGMETTLESIANAREIMESFDPGAAMTIGYDQESYTLSAEQMVTLAAALFHADCQLANLKIR